MALIKCPECKKKISDKCGKCPNCGYPIETTTTSVEVLDNASTSRNITIEKGLYNPNIKPKNNNKLLIGIICVAVVLLTVGGIWGYNALLPRIYAIKAFNEAVEFVKQKNVELETKVHQSEDLISKKQLLLDESFLYALENAISDAKAAKITDLTTPSKTENIISRTEELNKIDYSNVIANLIDKHTSLEINAKRYQLVNVPTEAYIIQRLKTIPEISKISAVTEDNDPNGNLNKAGGYISTVYFSHKLVNEKDIYGDTLIEKGTDAGGAIEVYTCVEDAVKRNDYLAAFDGSILASGSHTVIGTVLVRTSNELTATQQKEIELKLITALTYIEEIDGKQVLTIEEAIIEEPTTEEPTTEEPTTKEPTTKEPTTTTLSRNQLAVKKANMYFETDPEYPFTPDDYRWELKNEGFTDSEVEYALKNCNINWNERAVLCAKGYGQVREETIYHLTQVQGFSMDQAIYGVDNMN